MSSQPLISVVVPMYNAEKFISRCLEHLIHQTYSNIEIIIVDDGSTDNCVAICRDYQKQDKRIKIISQKNSGPANARNNGLDAATGQYVHFHDSDDFIELDYYENMVRTIVLTQSDVVCGGVDEIGYIFPKFDRIMILTDLYDKIAKIQAHHLNVVWRFLYRRDFLNANKIRFPKDMFIGEDRIFMYDALYLARSISTAPNTVYHCVYEAASLGKNATDIMKGRHNGQVDAWKNFNQFMDDSGIAKIVDKIEHGQVDYVRHWDFLGLKVFSIKYYSNNRVNYCVLNCPVFSRQKTHRKLRYFLLGLCVFRIYTDIK